MESATITKVTFRQEKLRSGKLSLYLDYYPPIWNPHIKKMSRREFLGLYLIRNRGGETPCRHSLQSGCAETSIAVRLHDRTTHQLSTNYIKNQILKANHPKNTK